MSIEGNDIINLFYNRTDKIAVARPGSHPAPIDVVDADDLARKLEEHKQGSLRIGAYAPAPDGTTKWLCIDLDGAGHESPLADPDAVAEVVLANLQALGLPAYLERSGSGTGWHVWVFSRVPIPASDARAIGFHVVPKDAPLATGGFANAKSNRGIEVFPKQDKLSDGGVGSMVFLPWWGAAQNGGAQFYRVTQDGRFEQYDPAVFDTATPEQVARAIAQVAKASALVKTKSLLNVVKHEANADDMDWHSPAAKAWRKRALDALPLESVYTDFLTGDMSGSGWLECRDPWSETGDQNPSASVADGSGEAERGTFHSFRTNDNLTIFDFIVRRGMAGNESHAAAMVAELSGVPLPEPLPAIEVHDVQPIAVVNRAWDVLMKSNSDDPKLFVRAGKLVRLEDDGSGARIEVVSLARMNALLTRSARWISTSEKRSRNVRAPDGVAQDMLTMPDQRTPRLETIGNVPVFNAAGELMAKPGYNASGMYYLLTDRAVQVPSVPTAPTADDVSAARALIESDLLGDMPFVSESDRAHVLAVLILPFARHLMPGCTPLFVIEAPSPGSGKGLLADCIALICTGAHFPVRTLPGSDDEIRKMITAELQTGRLIIGLDNAAQSTRGLDSASLAAVLTTETWTDRRLGASEVITVPNRAMWILTANNPRFTMELARRCVRIRMDAKQDQPWRRQGFKHPDLRGWVRQNRGLLVHAVLTLIQHWIASGRPGGKQVLGSFESWAKVTGGILGCAGVPNFLGNLDAMYEAADEEGQEWRDFTQAWLAFNGGAALTPGELNGLCQRMALLPLAVGNGDPKSATTKLGIALKNKRDCVFGTHRLTLQGNRGKHGKTYALVPVDQAERSLAKAS